jgi:hypothetical protein
MIWWLLNCKRLETKWSLSHHLPQGTGDSNLAAPKGNFRALELCQPAWSCPLLGQRPALRQNTTDHLSWPTVLLAVHAGTASRLRLRFKPSEHLPKMNLRCYCCTNTLGCANWSGHHWPSDLAHCSLNGLFWQSCEQTASFITSSPGDGDRTV